MFFFLIQMLIAVLFKAVQIENNPNIHQLENTECSYNEIVIKIQKKKTPQNTDIRTQQRWISKELHKVGKPDGANDSISVTS